MKTYPEIEAITQRHTIIHIHNSAYACVYIHVHIQHTVIVSLQLGYIHQNPKFVATFRETLT